jgi:replicative DNA helicase
MTNIKREIPCSPDAEEYFLSCCLLDGAESFSKGLESGLSAASFHSPANGLIFERIGDLISGGKPIELASLAQEIAQRRELDKIGGYAYLTQITSRIPTTAQVSYFSEKIVELYRLRQVIAQASALVEAAYGYTGEGLDDEILPHVTRLLETAAGGSSVKERTWGKVVSDSSVIADEYIAGGGPNLKRAISFGWPAVDRAFGPLMPGQLIIVAARPSIGKSSLLRPIALNAALAGRWVFFPTLEVKPDSIAIQFATLLSGFNPRRLSRSHEKDKADYRAAHQGLASLPLNVTNTRNTLASITAKAKALHATGKLDLLVIDYLGLIHDCDNPRKGELKASAIGRVTKALKRLAQELDIPIVIACQLNRQSTNDGNREPRLSDLRDSGDIEQDADKVILIHRPDEDEITRLPQSSTDDVNERPTFYQRLIQAKGRDDGTDEISMYFDRVLTRFRVAEKGKPNTIFTYKNG